MNRIQIHRNYAKYVVSHKWKVFVECRKRGLVWRGIVHDLSKLTPSEWIPYAYFFNAERTEARKADFHAAFNHHCKRNDHHWQYWVVHFEGPEGFKLKALEMPERCVREMVADWIGAAGAQGGDVNDWYAEHCNRIMLHPRTRHIVEDELAQLPPMLKRVERRRVSRAYKGDGE